MAIFRYVILSDAYNKDVIIIIIIHHKIESDLLHAPSATSVGYY